MSETDISKITNKTVLQLIRSYSKVVAHTEENYDFYFSKLSNEQQYKTFIKAGAPQQVNISSELRGKMDTLAASSSPLKYRSMEPHIKAARAEIKSLMATNTLAAGRFWADKSGKAATVILALGLDGDKAMELFDGFMTYSRATTPVDKQKAYAQMLTAAVAASKLNPALKLVGVVPPAHDAKKGKVLLDKLELSAETFQKQVTVEAAKDTTGGPTWQKVQQLSKAVPAAVLPMLKQMEFAGGDRAKLDRSLKTMKAQWDAIHVTDVEKYFKEHGAGGAKSRASGIKGAVTTAKTQAAEAARVKLCGLFIEQYKKLDLMIDRMDVDDLI